MLLNAANLLDLLWWRSRWRRPVVAVKEVHRRVLRIHVPEEVGEFGLIICVWSESAIRPGSLQRAGALGLLWGCCCWVSVVLLGNCVVLLGVCVCVWCCWMCVVLLIVSVSCWWCVCGAVGCVVSVGCACVLGCVWVLCVRFLGCVCVLLVVCLDLGWPFGQTTHTSERVHRVFSAASFCGR